MAKTPFFLKFSKIFLRDFPNFYRKIAEKIFSGRRFLLFSLIILLFYLWGSSFLPKTSFGELKLKVLKNYQDPKIHLQLAKEYFKNNDLENTQREISITEGLKMSEQEKEETLKFRQEVEKVVKMPEEIQKEIEKWEKISQDFPGYRDAYLQLAKFYFQLYQTDKARENLNKALELDPNYEPARELEKILKN